MSMNVLLTGASGFIGSNICKYLLDCGYNVFGTYHSSNTIPLVENYKNFQKIGCDLLDQNTVEKIIKDYNIQGVFHIAAQLPGPNDFWDPLKLVGSNTIGTLNILTGCARHGVKKIVYASSMSVYSSPPEELPVCENHPTCPTTLYGVSKLSGEMLCRSYQKEFPDVSIAILRYGGAYGIGQPSHNAITRFINHAQRDEPITIYGDGSQSSDFIYIDDVVTGTVVPFERGISGTYNIGGEEEYSVLRLANKIKSLTGSKSDILFADNTNRPFRFIMDVKKAKEDFGYSSRSVEQGLTEYIKLLETQNYKKR